MLYQGPFSLFRAESVPTAKESEGIWTITWTHGSMIFAGWNTALSWLEHRVDDGRIFGSTVLYAGALRIPWVIEWYLAAARAAQRGHRPGVFEAYSKSAMLLLDEDEAYELEGVTREALMLPWRTNA